MSGKINASPSFRLMGQMPLLPKALPKDKHSEEFEALTEQIRILDQSTKDMIKKLEKMHKRRTKYARQIANFINKHQEEKKETKENRLLQIQSERLGRLNLCSRLLDSRCRLSSLIKNQPLPDLQHPKTSMGERPENVQQGSDSLLNFLRTTTPEGISNFFLENAIPKLLVYCSRKKFNRCGLNVDINEFVQSLPSIIVQIPYQNRLYILQKILDTYHESNNLTQLFEYTALLTSPTDIIRGIEHGASNLLRCRKVKLLVASELSKELTYMHSGIRRTVPMTTGLIYDVVQKGTYRIVKDPINSNEIDLAVESMIFEGAKSSIIVPLYHPDYLNPFVIIASDKVREEGFTASDYVLTTFFFKHISMQLKFLVREISSITETDMTNLVHGLSLIAATHNAHEMIQKVSDVSDHMIDATQTRLFTIVNDCLCEETPGIKLGGKMLTLDHGLICRAAIQNETMNYFLPRREKTFSISIDDITQPRIWSMVAAPITFHGEVKGAYVLYNRRNGTFFSARETYIASNLARCISSLIHICCESTNLQDSLERNNDNILHAYNLTVYALKSIQTAGTSKLFESMQQFCNKMKPKIHFRFLIYENDKLLDAETNQQVTSEPRLLDAICDLKPTAATAETVGILVIPIKMPNGVINLFEFRAPLMQLKSEEESNGILQRTRLMQSLDNKTLPLQVPEQIKLGRSSRRNSLIGRSSGKLDGSSSSFFDLSKSNSSIKMPFVPLSLKSVHDDDLSSTSVFELTKDSSTYDKFLIVSANKSFSLSTFEEQLDEDKLQIYPFDSYITTLLQSFALMTSRQLSLHHKIVSLKGYDKYLRGLHILGNVLACPMPFSSLLDILMRSFTCLFGQSLSLSIYDPPLFDSNENDLDPTALNLERDRMIFASIKIPETMAQERSTALACFADLLLALMASRADNQRSNPIVSMKFPQITSQLDLNFLEMNIQETIGLTVEIFAAFHVHEVLDCTREKINIWLGRLAVNPEEASIFLLAVDALQFTYAVHKQLDLFKYYSKSELAATCIASFMRVGFPHMRPDFKYQDALKILPLNKVPRKILVRMTTALICLADPECDLLENTKPEILTGLAELLLARSNINVSVTVAKFILHAKRGFDLEQQNHKELMTQFITELCQSSLFFRPLPAFEKTCLMSRETQSTILYRIRKVVQPQANALELASHGCTVFTEALSDKEPWVLEKGEDFFSAEANEEEEQGNIPLIDAR